MRARGGTQDADDWNQSMTQFYNVFPYPGRPFWVLPDERRMLLAHGGFAKLLLQGERAVARGIWRDCHPSARARAQGHEARSRRQAFASQLQSAWGSGRILLAGCGTDEAVLYRLLHPLSPVDGVDLSRRSLLRARMKLGLAYVLRPLALARSFFGQRSRLRLFCGDLRALLCGRLSGQRYDLIVCYGVLHHQRDPRSFLGDLVAALLPGGCLRLMVYTQTGRSLERSSQRLLGAPVGKPKIGPLRLFLRAWGLQLWLAWSRLQRRGAVTSRLAYLRGGGRKAIADALLHPCDPGLAPGDLGLWLDALGCEVLYCSAKSDALGWLSGIEEPVDTWRRILDEEKAGRLLSNIELIVRAPQGDVRTEVLPHQSPNPNTSFSAPIAGIQRPRST